MAAGVAQGVGETAALRCAVCGVREPVRSDGRSLGWQRCAHCGAVNVMPWSRAEALDAPNARTVVLQRRGRAHFVVPRHTLLSNPELAAWLFLTFTIGGLLIGLFELEADPSGVWRQLGPALIGLGMLLLAAALLRGWRVEQHLEISPRRMRVYRTLGSWKHRIAERSLRDHPLSIEVRRSTGDDTLAARFRVELAPEADARPPLALTVRNELEARWIAAMVGLAASASPSGGTRCAGCGAPIEVTLDEHASGSVECTYCSAGLVLGAQRMRWSPVALPQVDGLGSQAPRSVRATRCRDALRFELLPRHRVARAFHAAGLLYGVALFGLLGGFMAWMLPEMPEGAIGLRIWGLCGAILLLGIAGFLLALIALSLFGREEICIDEGSVRTASRLGPLRWSRASRPGAGDAQQPSTRVPILRIVRVSLERDEGRTQLVLTTPNRRLVAGWSLEPAGDRWLSGQILDALASRLRALGREVRRS